MSTTKLKIIFKTSEKVCQIFFFSEIEKPFYIEYLIFYKAVIEQKVLTTVLAILFGTICPSADALIHW